MNKYLGSNAESENFSFLNTNKNMPEGEIRSFMQRSFSELNWADHIQDHYLG